MAANPVFDLAKALVKSVGGESRSAVERVLVSNVDKILREQIKTLPGAFKDDKARDEFIHHVLSALRTVIQNFKLSGMPQIAGNAEDRASERVKRLVDALKKTAAFSNMPIGSLDEAVGWIKKNLPLGPSINGKSIKPDPKIINGIRSMAQILNEVMHLNIDVTGDPAIVARDVSVAFMALNSHYVADFAGLYASLNLNVDRITVLAKVLSIIRAQLDATDAKDERQLDVIKKSLDVIESELESRVSMLRTSLHSDNVQSLVSEIFNSGRAVNTIGLLTELQSSDPKMVAEEVMRNLTRVSSTLDIANKLSKWYHKQNSELDSIIDKFLDAGTFAELKKIVEQKMHDINIASSTVTINGETITFLEAVQDILKWSQMSNDSARKEMSQVIRGRAEFSMGDRVKQQLDRAKLVRAAIVRQTSIGISAKLADIIHVIRAISAGMQDGSVPTDQRLRNLHLVLTGLNALDKKGVYNAILGVHNALGMDVTKSSFLDNLQVIQRTADAIGGPLMQQLSSKVKDLGNYIDEVSSANARQYDSAVYGVVGNAEELFTPQLNTVLKNLNSVMQDMVYAMNFHSGMVRIKKAGQMMEQAGEVSKNVRAEAVAENLNRINDDKEALIKRMNDASATGLQSHFNVDWADGSAAAKAKEKDAAIAMINDMYAAQVKLYQTAEAVDAMMENFVKAVAKDPSLLKELYREIQVTGGIAEWFNEVSGNQLAEWFEMFPHDINDEGRPVRKEGFKIEGHYYEMFTKEVNVKAIGAAGAAATEKLSAVFGNHMTPLPPSEYSAAKLKGMAVFQSTGALKNVFSAFISIARQIGGMKVESFMSPSTMYKNIIEYLAVSALSRGFMTSDPAKSFAQLDVANGVKTAESDNSFTNATTSRLEGTDGKLTSVLIGAAHAGVANVDADARSNLLRIFGVFGATVYDQYQSKLDETDRVFVLIVQSMYAKIMTAIETYNMIHRPIHGDRFRHIRSIMGGSDDTPDARPEYAQLYLGLVLLAEYYRALFMSEPPVAEVRISMSGGTDSNRFISIIPEGASAFTSLVSLIFQKFKDVPDGAYGDYQVRELLKAINAIIDKYNGSPAERLSTIVDDFIKDINQRYCVMEVDDVNRYKELIADLRPQLNDDDKLSDSVAMDDLAILPGETDLFDFGGLAPSESQLKSTGRAGEGYSLQRRRIHDGYRKLLNKFRAKADEHMNESKMLGDESLREIAALLKDTEYKMRTAKDQFSRYLELSKIISTASADSAVDMVKTMMLQEVYGGLDLLRYMAAFLLRATSLSRYMSSPVEIMRDFSAHFAGVNSWEAFFKRVFDDDLPFAKYVAVKGCREPAILAKVVSLIPTIGTVTWNNLTTLFGAAIQTNSKGEPQHAAEYAQVVSLIQCVVDYDLMFADLINICVDLDQFNVEKNNSGRLVDIAINGKSISVSYGNLQENIQQFCGEVKKIIDLMRPQLSEAEFQALSNKDSLSIGTLTYLFTNVLFAPRSKSLDIDVSAYSMANLADNLSKGLQYMTGANRVAALTVNCAEYLTRAGAGAAANWDAATNDHGPMPFPIKVSPAGPITNLEFVARSLVYFNSLLPTAGIVEHVKELRKELPLFATVAPVLDKTIPGMMWRYELGFPSVLKPSPASVSHTMTSLMFSFNSLMYAYLSEIMDPINGKIYQKALAPFLGSDSMLRLEKSFPDTYPNMAAVRSHLLANGGGDASNLVRSLLDGNMGLITALPAPTAAGADPMTHDLQAFATSTVLAASNLVSPFGSFIDVSPDMYATPVKEKAYGVSLEQMIIATQFLSSVDKYPQHTPALTGVNNMHGDRAGTYSGSTVQLLILSLAYVTGQVTYAAAATDVLPDIAKRSHKFLENLFTYIPDRVRYRIPRESKFVFWGHRKDPQPDQPFLGSIAYLLHMIATSKPDVVTPDSGLKHIWGSLTEVPAHCRDVMKVKLPYYAMQFDALVRRCEITRSIMKDLNIQTVLTDANYSQFDICDPKRTRSTVWASNFQSNLLKLMDSIVVAAQTMSRTASDAAADLNDAMKYMDIFPDREFGPLSAAMLFDRYDDLNGQDLDLNDMANVNSMKLLYGIRCLLSKNAPEPDLKQFSFFDGIVKKYNDLAQDGFKISEQLSLGFVKGFVKLFRYSIGGRMMKRNWSNQTKFADDVALPVNDVTFGDNSLYAADGAGAVINAGDASALMNAMLSSTRSDKLNQFLNSLLVFSQFTKVSGANRVADLLAAHSEGGEKLYLPIDDPPRTTYPSQTFAGKSMLHRLSEYYYIAPKYNTAASLWSPATSTLMGYNLKNTMLAPFTPSHARPDLIMAHFKGVEGLKKFNYSLANDEPTMCFANCRDPRNTDVTAATAYGKHTYVYFEISRFMNILSTSSSEEALREFCRILQNNIRPISRADMRKNIINFMNIIPINANLLSREIPFANLYNSAYNFRQFLRHRLISSSQSPSTITLAITDDCDSLSGARSEDEFLYKFLVNPYAKIDALSYSSIVGSMMRGNGDTELGRPQYLSDQVFSKALMGSLYDHKTSHTRGGPQKTARRSGGEHAWKSRVFAEVIVRSLTTLLIHNEQLWKERDAMLQSICNDRGNLWRYDHLADGQLGGERGITTARVFDALWGDSITPYGGFSARNGGLNHAYYQRCATKSKEPGQYQIMLSRIALLTQLLALGRTDGSGVAGSYGLDSRTVPEAGRTPEYHNVQAYLRQSRVDFRRSLNGAVNQDHAFNTVALQPPAGTQTNGDNALSLSRRLARFKVGMYGDYVTTGYNTLRAISDRGNRLNVTLNDVEDYKIRKEADLSAGWRAKLVAGAAGAGGTYDTVDQAASILPDLTLLHAIRDDSGNVRQIPCYTALDFYFEKLGLLTATDGEDISTSGKPVVLQQLWNAPLNAAQCQAMGHLSYLLSAGYCLPIGLANDNNNIRVYPSVGLPQLDIQTGQGQGPLFAATRKPRSRAGAGYEIGVHWGHMSSAFAAQLSSMEIANTAAANCASAVSTMAADKGIYKALVASITDRIASLAGTFTDRLPAAFVGHDIAANATTLFSETQRDNRVCSWGHQLRALYSDASVKVYNNAIRRAVKVDNTHEDTLITQTPTLANDVTTVNTGNLRPFFAAVMFAYAFLDSFIPNQNRVDQIITTALFSPTSDFLRDQTWAGDSRSIIGLIKEFFDNVRNSIGANSAGYKPFDASFYDIHQLHNVGISYGAELGSKALSCAYYDRLMAAYKNPAICLPVQHASDESLVDASIAEYIAGMKDLAGKQSTLLASYLAENSDDSLSGWLSHLDRTFGKTFGDSTENIPNQWTFSFDRGLPDSPMSACSSFTRAEQMAREKSIDILKSHARLVLIAAYTYLQSSSKPAPTRGDTKHDLDAIMTNLGAIPKNSFFNATIFKTHPGHSSMMTSTSNAASLTGHLAKLTATAITAGDIARCSQPVKFGFAAFYPNTDSFGQLSKAAEKAYFDAITQATAGHLDEYTNPAKKVVLTVCGLYDQPYIAHVNAGNVARTYGNITRNPIHGASARTVLDGPSLAPGLDDGAYNSIVYKFTNIGAQGDLIGKARGEIMTVAETVDANDPGRDFDLKFIRLHEPFSQSQAYKHLQSLKTLKPSNDDVWANLGIHPSAHLAIPLSVLEQGAPIIYNDSKLTTYEPRLRIDDSAPMWSIFDNSSFDLLYLTLTADTHTAARGAESFVPWLGYYHHGEHLLNVFDRINNTTAAAVDVSGRALHAAIKAGYQSGVGVMQVAGLPVAAEPGKPYTITTNGGAAQIAGKALARGDVAQFYNTMHTGLITPQDAVALFDANQARAAVRDAHALLSAEVLRQGWNREHYYMYSAKAEVPYATALTTDDAVLATYPYPAAADAAPLTVGLEWGVNFTDDTLFDKSFYATTSTIASYSFDKPQIFSYLENGNIKEVPAFNDHTDFTTKFGKFRFDTKIVRNLFFIHLVHNILARDLLTRLTDLSKDPLYGKASFNAAVRNYNSSDSHKENLSGRMQDREGWAMMPQ